MGISMGNEYETMKVEVMEQGYAKITFEHPQSKNAINQKFISELNHIFDSLEKECNCKAIILSGTSTEFCIGMDFHAIEDQAASEYAGQLEYQKLLNRLKNFPRLIISIVEGKVLAGGIGIIAVSDYVIAEQKASFGLPEAMWGQLPAMVLPYLQLRVGYQNAKRMTLMFSNLSALQAERIGLIDEVTDEVSSSLKRVLFRFLKLSLQTIKIAKEYTNFIHPISDEVQKTALELAKKLAQEEEVRNNIERYNLYNKFPWED